MKLASALAIAALGLGIVACASVTEDAAPAEELGTSTQALCAVGRNCRPPVSGGSSGFVFEPVVDDPPPEPPVTFECKGRSAHCSINDAPPYNRYLSCNPNDPTQCVCNWCGSAGGWPYGSFSICPSSRPNYGCTNTGYCTCY